MKSATKLAKEYAIEMRFVIQDDSEAFLSGFRAAIEMLNSQDALNAGLACPEESADYLESRIE